ncbi:MAG: class I SAM-dependent methyltransferase [Myxococcota bacterium]|nr:class I SAM-dependent methyltransferase [Myxococcota bacterium]
MRVGKQRSPAELQVVIKSELRPEVSPEEVLPAFRFDLPQFLDGELELPRSRPPAAPLPVRERRGRVLGALTDWRLKGALQKVLGVAPGGRRLHAMLQRRLGVLRHFDRECATKLHDWQLMMGHLREAGVDHTRACMLEVGTGWYPTLPICCYLAGTPRMQTIDLAHELDPTLTLLLVQTLGAHLPMIAEVSRCDLAEVTARHTRLHASLAEGASLARATQLALDYRAPCDVARTGICAGTFDVVFSNSALEHLRPSQVDACFVESMRILRPGGVMIHAVNCGDHYAYLDPRIGQLHYLAYSDEAWTRWNNAFLYQNRLRAVDFITRCRATGFAVEIDTSRPHPQRLEELASIALAPRFSGYTREQLAVTSIDFVGRKPAPDDDN